MQPQNCQNELLIEGERIYCIFNRKTVAGGCYYFALTYASLHVIYIVDLIIFEIYIGVYRVCTRSAGFIGCKIWWDGIFHEMNGQKNLWVPQDLFAVKLEIFYSRTTHIWRISEEIHTSIFWFNLFALFVTKSSIFFLPFYTYSINCEPNFITFPKKIVK